MKMRSAIIVGGTGLVGSSLVNLLCESDEYVSVTVIARRKLEYEHPKLTVKVRSFDYLEEGDIDFAHEVFCCLGTTIKKAGSRQEFEKVDVEYPLRVASLAKKRGIMHFIHISAMGAKENSNFYYNRVKAKVEKELIALELPQLSIVRPSLLTGNRQEFRFGEKIGEKSLAILNPIMFGPLKKFHSIKASQVALAMKVIALHGKKGAVTIYESPQLLKMKMPQQKEEKPIPREQLFNWDKLKKDEPAPLDEEIIFNKKKLQAEEAVLVDREITFNKKKIQVEEPTPLDEKVSFNRKKVQINESSLLTENQQQTDELHLLYERSFNIRSKQLGERKLIDKEDSFTKGLQVEDSECDEPVLFKNNLEAENFNVLDEEVFFDKEKLKDFEVDQEDDYHR